MTEVQGESLGAAVRVRAQERLLVDQSTAPM
jgi:hypothetical protein